VLDQRGARHDGDEVDQGGDRFSAERRLRATDSDAPEYEAMMDAHSRRSTGLPPE